MPLPLLQSRKTEGLLLKGSGFEKHLCPEVLISYRYFPSRGASQLPHAARFSLHFFRAFKSCHQNIMSTNKTVEENESQSPTAESLSPISKNSSPLQSIDYEEKQESLSNDKQTEVIPVTQRENNHEQHPPGQIHRLIYLLRAKNSDVSPSLPPDGGLIAWIQALLCHLAIFNTWGYVNSFGIFQTYYTSTLSLPPSTISWIGSLQIFLLFFIGTWSGRATDAGFFRPVFILGSLIQLLGIFTTSFTTKYWQILLSQGICTGIGNGLVFCPSVAILSGYFSRKRALAIGVAASGSATGGVIIPAIASHLLPRIGFGWTLRVIAFLMLGTICFTIPFFKSRFPPRRTGPIVELAAFEEVPYLLFSISMFLTFWGLYFAFYYVGVWAKEMMGVDGTTSISLLMVLNGVGLFGRLLPGYLADRYFGPLNCLIPFVFFSSICLYCWAAVVNLVGVNNFAVFYGFFAAGIQSLFLATMGSLTTDIKKIGVRMGMVLTVISIPALTGSPLAGALVQRGKGEYLYAQMFAGSSMFLGLIFLVAARGAKAGWRVALKI